MATTCNEVYKILRELFANLSLIDRNLEHIRQEREGAPVLDILNVTVTEMEGKQADLKIEFYEFLSPLYTSGEGDLDLSLSLSLSQLQDEIFRKIGNKSEDEITALLEGLLAFKKTGNDDKEKIDDLIKDYQIKPRKHVSYAIQVAIESYGFPMGIAADIEGSLGDRKMIRFEGLLYDEEGEIGIEDHPDEDKWVGKDAGGVLNWIIVGKLRTKFEDLNQKLYRKEELGLPKVSNDDKNFLSQRKTLVKVIRNWLFRMESAFFNVIYDLYQILSGNVEADTIFKEWESGLKSMKETNDGMVSITVYKIIHMMENPLGLEIGGDATTMKLVRGIGTENLHEKIMRLNEVTTLVHKMVSSFRLVLATLGLCHKQVLEEDQSALVGKLLIESEEDVREMERNINWIKSELKKLNEVDKGTTGKD